MIMETEKTPLVSIILPAYNVQKYITECVDSILKQTFDDFEIIIVDDGSKDDTYAVMNELAEKDKRIQIFHQENAGSGPARNAGIRLSSGKYIMFVDPDDWIDENMLEDYIRLANEKDADLIASGYIEHIAGPNGITLKNFALTDWESFSIDEVRKNYIRLYVEEAVCGPTGILYKKSIIEENKVQFPDLRRSQDIVFNYRYYRYITSAITISKLYYHYRIESANYLSKMKEDYYKTIELLYAGIMELHKSWSLEIDDENTVLLNNKFLVTTSYYLEACITRGSDISDKIQRDTIKNIADKSSPLDSYHKMIRRGIITGKKSLVINTIKTKLFVKTHFRGIFERLRNIKKY